MKTIEVLNYNPDWKDWFNELKSHVWPSVSEHALSIEHIGSTSVVGLSAKPVIDIDIIADNGEEVVNCIKGLQSIGYSHVGDLGIKGREAFRIESPQYAHNLYVCLNGCDSLKNHLVLRDHLKKNKLDMEKYSILKINLAKEFPNDIDGYIEGKTNFILGVLNQYDFSSDVIDTIQEANRKK